MQPNRLRLVLENAFLICAQRPGASRRNIGGALGGTGLLIANEYDTKRAKALSENIERLGFSNAIVLNETPDRLAKRFPGYFDKARGSVRPSAIGHPGFGVFDAEGGRRARLFNVHVFSPRERVDDRIVHSSLFRY